MQPQWVISSVSRLRAVALSATWGTSLATRWMGTMLAAPSRESSSSGHETGSEGKKHPHDLEGGGVEEGEWPTFNNAVVGEVQVEQEEHVQQRQRPAEQQPRSLTHSPGQQRRHLQASTHYYHPSDERGRA